MITEDYVSFEVAKLLKEKGFNKDTYTMSMYDENGEAKDVLLLKVGEEPVLRPTLQMAMKWLREVHNIHIEIRYSRYSNKYHYKIIYGPTELDDYVSKPHVLRTYEEAAEESIKHCLEMLVK